MTQNERNIQLIKDSNYNTLVKENERMVYYVLSKYNLYPLTDDIVNIGRIGLFKAAKTFKLGIGNFSPYAYKCITNEVFYYLRNEKKQNMLNVRLFSDIHIQNMKNGSKQKIEDILVSDINIDSDLKNIDFYNTLKDAIQLLPQKEKDIFIMHLLGYTQKNISKKINHSQPYISKLIKNSKDFIKQYMIQHGIDLYYFS